jgi:putative methyltransferase (TIGR04325 family)
MGSAYVFLSSQLSACTDIDYVVIDVPRVCDEGARLFRGDTRISFHSSPPEGITPDIVYVASSLQYVEDYTSMIGRLGAYRAPYFLYTKLQAGDVPTFASIQTNIGSSQIPYWFYNRSDILRIMRENAYGLLFEEVRAFGYDQTNLPGTHRLRYSRNLLFGLEGVGR